jgi:hypothetical protein
MTNIVPQLSNWRLLPHVILTILGMAPAQTMGSYAPSLVVSFGFDRLKSNAMISIGAWVAIITNVSYGFIADKTKLRGLTVLVGCFIIWGLTVSPVVFLLYHFRLQPLTGYKQIGNRLLVDSTNGNLRFGVLVTSIAFHAPWRKSSRGYSQAL